MNKQTFSIGLGAIGGFVACWLVVGMSGCGKGGGGDVIAVVNGESITTDDFYKYLEFKPDVRVMTADGTVATLQPEGTLGFQAFQDLIGQRVTIQLAKDKKMYPSDGEVTKELEFRKKLNPNFLTTLTGRGFTFDMIRESITLDLIRERLLSSGITITDADIAKYQAENPKEFEEPERVDISYILVQDLPTKAKVDQELQAGQSFTQVALRYSAAPDVKENNGKLIDRRSATGMPAVEGLPKPVQEAIKSFKGGETTEWITLADGYAKFYVAKRVPSHKIVLDEAKKEYLRRALAQAKGREGRDLERQVLGKLKDSKVEVRRTSFQAPWKEAYRRFMVDNKLESVTGSPSK